MAKKEAYTKWAAYGIALFLIFIFQTEIFSRFTLFGVYPAIIPLAVAMVAVFEGPVGGAGFGLAAGILYDVFVSPSGGAYILVFVFVGAAVGIMADFAFNKGFFSCVVSSFAALLILALFKSIYYLISGRAAFLALVTGISAEIAYSIILTIPIYLLIRKIYVFSHKNEI